ncbi:MAG: MbnP family protein [Chitinophagaceae bacterium]
MNKGYLLGLFVVVILVTGFVPGRRDAATMTTIHFKHWVGNKELVLFDETYTNSFGEPFVVNKFRYYISGLSFTDAQGEHSLPENYYLVDEADSLSKTIQLPAAGIQSISFIIGVDSSRSTGGVQTGSLDPANGMFWTWNSGYVFAKLEGQSDSSHAPVHSLSWHVGGFRQQENALRRIKLTVSSQAGAANNTIIVHANILKWFDAVHPLKISQSPVCHQAGKLAMLLADNYSAMFSVVP